MKHPIFLLLFILVFVFKASGRDYVFNQYTIEDGLNHSFIYAINQDNDGFLWIGTEEGLYRFDGIEFKYYNRKDGLADNFVSNIFRDEGGQLWFGHQNGSISYFTEGGFKVINVQSELQGAVSDITEDDNGLIWVCNQNKGLQVINTKKEIESITFPMKQELLSSIQSLSNNLFLIGSQDNIYLSRYDMQLASMEIIERIDAYPGSKNVEIYPISEDNYIVVSQDEGIYSFSLDLNSLEYEFAAIDSNYEGILDNLQGGTEDKDGNIWLNSMGNGLVKYAKGEDNEYQIISRISTDNGLVSDNIKSVFEDKEGNLWCGMYGEGLLRYVDNELQFYRFGLENEGAKMYAVSGNTNNLVVVAGDHLLDINPIDEKLVNSYPLPIGFLYNMVSSIYYSDDGEIWLGSDQKGLYVADTSDFKFKNVFLSSDELKNSVNHITGDKDYIWIATKKGLCRISRKNKTRKWITSEDGLPNNNIQQVYIDSNGRVLIATTCKQIHYINRNGEVAHLENGVISNYNAMVSIAEGGDGALWIGTLGNGVWKFHNKEFINYTTDEGLESNFCYSLALTKSGKVIVGHRAGISQINPTTQIIKTYNGLDGVKSSTEFYTNAVFSNSYGTVWFGTSEGLVRYDSEISDKKITPTKLYINTLLVNGHKVDHTKAVLLKSGYYELQVEYIGIHFANPEKIKYQTMLEGYTNKWSETTPVRRVVFDKVGYGDYTFQLKAFNEDDIHSQMNTGIKLHIQKPIYLTFWFIVISFSVFILIILIIIRQREKDLRTVQERLIQNLDEKTKDIIVKEEIIKERKKVEKVLIEAKTKAELSDKLKTSFLSNISHEIRTPMNAIVGNSHLLKADGFTEVERSGFVDSIIHNSDNMLVLVNDMMDVSKLETNQLEINMGPCNVNLLMQELECKYLLAIEKLKKVNVDFLIKTPRCNNLVMITDAIRLQQVLTKLLDNAVKYTEQGSITLGYELKNNEIIFLVEDTGIGLSEDKMEVIFDLFRKIEDDKLKLYRGAGLGLTLSRSLVKLLGGEIHVESRKNEGSKFYIVLPLSEKKNMFSAIDVVDLN